MIKKDLKLKKSTRIEILAILLLASVVGIVFGFYMFQNGFHNIDIAQNMKYLNAELDLELMDLTMQNEIVDCHEAYRVGLWQQRMGIFLATWSAMLFGMSITDLMQVAKHG